MNVKNRIFSDGTWEALTELGTKDLPFKMGYDISRIIRKMKDGVEVYQEARNKLITELGTTNEEGNASIDPKDKETIKKFNEEMLKVSELEEEYDIKKVVINTKEMDEKKVEIKPNMLVLLEDFIEVK